MSAQINTTAAHLASANARNAVSRVQDLEKSVQTIIDTTNDALNTVGQEIGSLKELVRALVDAVGLDAVDANIQSNRRKDDAANVEKMKKAIGEGLSNGDLKAAEVISEKCLLVFCEKDKEGKPLEFGSRKQFLWNQVLPKFHSDLLGKVAGASITSPNGNTFEVVEFYELVPKAPAAPATDAK